MRKIIIPAFVILFILSSITLVFAWGSWGHKHINRGAVFALPIEMRTFYYNHIDFITEGSVVPDLRRALINDKTEAPKHYIDIEDFKNTTLDQLPKTWKEAQSKYDSVFLQKTGILPWYIQGLMEKLTTAFTRKNRSEIIFLSAEIGHYVGDAHVPLHTSSNHDGQLTNQKGIHAFWESQIPGKFGENYNFLVSDAKFIDDITTRTWEIIKHSHILVDTLLLVEKQTRAGFPEDKLYEKDEKGNNILRYSQPIFSIEYLQKYNAALNGMVQNQMRLSISDLADYWYTAWVNGGKPDLNLLDDPNLAKQNSKNFKKEMKAWRKGKLMNLSGSGENN